MTIAERYRISPKTAVNLKEWDPDDLSAFKGGKAKAEPAAMRRAPPGHQGSSGRPSANTWRARPPPIQ